MAGDWIKLHRKIIESQVFSDADLLRVWMYLLVRANYKPSFFRGQRIEVGEVAFSQRVLSDLLGVSRGKLQRSIKTLEEMGNVTSKASHDFTVVTICNWQTYQTADDSVRSTDGTTGEATGRTTDGTTNGATNGTIPKKERSLRSERREETPDSSEPPSAASEQPLMEFPTVGKGEKTWALVPSFVATLTEAFPGLDVLAECRKARAWCEANTPKRKTPGGMPKFLFGWMERNQNRGGVTPSRVSGDPRGNLAVRERMKEANRAQ